MVCFQTQSFKNKCHRFTSCYFTYWITHTFLQLLPWFCHKNYIAAIILFLKHLYQLLSFVGGWTVWPWCTCASIPSVFPITKSLQFMRYKKQGQEYFCIASTVANYDCQNDFQKATLIHFLAYLHIFIYKSKPLNFGWLISITPQVNITIWAT